MENGEYSKMLMKHNSQNTGQNQFRSFISEKECTWKCETRIIWVNYESGSFVIIENLHIF